MAYDYDLFVIGAGSGGVRASRIAAGYGARVGICDDYRVGGTCVIRGCVPKKLLVYGSKFAHEFEDSAAYGWVHAEATHSWATLRDNVQKEVDRLNAVYIRILEGPGVKIHMGRGAPSFSIWSPRSMRNSSPKPSSRTSSRSTRRRPARRCGRRSPPRSSRA